MRSTRALFATCVAGALAACAPADSGPTVDLAAEEQTIRDLSMQWMQAAQAEDAAAVAALFTADGTTIFDGEMVVGPAAIQTQMEADIAEMPDAEISWTTNAVQVAASGDMAYERGSWTVDPDGMGEMEPVGGEYVTVWIKEAGEWKVAVDAGSTIPPMDEDEDDGDMDDDM